MSNKDELISRTIHMQKIGSLINTAFWFLPSITAKKRPSKPDGNGSSRLKTGTIVYSRTHIRIKNSLCFSNLS